MLTRFDRCRFSLCAALCSLALVSCGSYISEPVGLASYPSPGDDQGVICVARIGSEGTEQGVPVWDNDVLVGANGLRCHFCYPAAPGRHVVRSENYVTAELTVQVQPGTRTVIKQDVDASAFPRPRGKGLPLGGALANNADTRRMEWVELAPLRDDEGELAMNQSQRCALREVPRGERVPRGGRIRARED